jgi:CRP-like cAMP-binding protein
LLDALLAHAPSLGEVAFALDAAVGTPLVVAGGPIDRVFFPTTGVLSVVVRTSDGGTAEALTVGCEGFIGLAAWFGLGESLEEVLQQASGSVTVLPARDFRAAVAGSPRCENLLRHYAAYALRTGEQNSVCNGRHSVRQRASRWILSTADRRGEPAVRMTHALLAEMIGVRRQSVTDALDGLERDGAVVSRRGRIEIPSRAALEAQACECYRTTRELYRRIVAPLL